MRGKKTGGRDFKKGQSGNPAGATAFPLEIKRLRRLNAQEYALILADLTHSSIADLELIESDETQTAMRRTVAGLIIKAFNNKCVLTWETLMNRIIGRVRDVTPEKDPDESGKGQALLAEFREVVNDPRNERT